MVNERWSPRTIQDLIRKYNFDKLLGYAENVEYQEGTIVRINNELNNMLNSMIINLSDVINNQSEITLWFFDGIPSMNSNPAVDWTTQELIDEHAGDFYYDKGSGRVFKFNEEWTELHDPRLIQGMASSNATIDTVEDHQRVVYINTEPTTPYNSGDWWITEDGNLYICQIARATGPYIEDDFIISSLYGQSIADFTNNMLTIISGAVTTMKATETELTSRIENHTQLINDNGESLGMLSQNYSQIQQTVSGLSIVVGGINSTVDDIQVNGVNKVVTATGYRFDENALSIAKSGEEMNSQLDNTGLIVKRDDDVVLVANNNGVEAENITLRKYLIIGANSRMEDYQNGTGIFYIGE